jgi:hypothetical protein
MTNATIHHFTAAELEEMETLWQGHTDNLKYDDGETRYWLSRMTVADGMPYDNAVTVETLTDGRWITVAEYQG